MLFWKNKNQVETKILCHSRIGCNCHVAIQLNNTKKQSPMTEKMSTSTTATTTVASTATTATSTPSESRKPGVSNWFSSLRRLPKKHKNAKKTLQKSCVDLTVITAGSPATIDTNSSTSSSVTNSPRLKNGINAFFNRENKLVSAIKCATPPLTTISKIETLEIDQEKQIFDPKSPNRTVKSPLAATATTTTASSVAASNTALPISPEQLQITTTTKITQTTVITKQSHRVGLIFDDDGELISNLETYRNLANDFNNQLIIDGVNCTAASGHGIGDAHGVSSHNNNTINSNYNCHDSFNGLIPNRPFKSNSLEDEFEFIDSSSSLSDIGGSRNDLYFNYATLPKSCSTCKSKSKSMSDWNLSAKKVYIYFMSNAG